MMIEDNKVLVRRLYDEVVSPGNPALLSTLVAPGFVSHAPDIGDGVGGERSGIDGFADELATLRSLFSEFSVTLERLVGAGDRVAVHGVTRGRHTNGALGIAPTGDEVTTSWTAIYRIADGKLAERWVNADDLSTFQQLGVIPRQ